MSKEKDFVVIDRIDYDELVKQADMTKAEIEERAMRIYLDKNTIPVRVEFNEYRNVNNFSAPIGYVRGSCFWEALDEIEPQVTAWMDCNMQKYGERMKENHTTVKACKGLRKQVANLEEYRKKHRIRFTILIWYAIILTINFFLLLTSYVTGLKSLI